MAISHGLPEKRRLWQVRTFLPTTRPLTTDGFRLLTALCHPTDKLASGLSFRRADVGRVTGVEEAYNVLL